MDYRERCYQSLVTGHWQFTHTLSKEEYELYATVAKRRFSRFLPENRSARILDLACGAGHLLYCLQKEGYNNARGIDVSPEQVEVAAKRGVRNVEQADLFDYLANRSSSFDMITAFDVIEHLNKQEVLEFLDMINDALVPGGRVLVGTVNALSLLGSGIVWCTFTHEQGFTAGSLSEVLRVCKFDDVAVFGEEPIVHDVRSAIRAGLWRVLRAALKFYVNVERGTGRGLWNRYQVFESRIFGVGTKPDG